MSSNVILLMSVLTASFICARIEAADKPSSSATQPASQAPTGRDDASWAYVSYVRAFNADGQQSIGPYESNSWMEGDGADGWTTLAILNNSSRSALVVQWSKESQPDKDGYLSLDGKAGRGWLVFDWQSDSEDQRKSDISTFLKMDVEQRLKLNYAYPLQGWIAPNSSGGRVHKLRCRKLSTRDKVVPPRRFLEAKLTKLAAEMESLRADLRELAGNDDLKLALDQDEAKRGVLQRVLDGDVSNAYFKDGDIRGYDPRPRFRIPFDFP